MQLTHLFLSLLTATTCTAVAVTPHAMCGNPAPSKEYRQVLAEAQIAEASASASANAKRATTTVKTYVHIIAADNSRAGGAIGVCLSLQEREKPMKHC